MNKLGSVSVGGSNPVRFMGILNVSPESFYKKSIKTTKQQITEAVKNIEEQGADFIDVGGMSTAPYLSTIISETDEAEFQKTGKNIYITNNERNIRLTINSYTNRIITADRLNNKTIK